MEPIRGTTSSTGPDDVDDESLASSGGRVPGTRSGGASGRVGIGDLVLVLAALPVIAMLAVIPTACLAILIKLLLG